MTAMAQEPTTQEEVLLEGFLALRVPEVFRAELIEGEIVLTCAPDGDHEDYIGLIVSQVIRNSQEDMQFSGNKGLLLTNASSGLKNRVIPGGVFAPQRLRLYRGADPWMPCTGIALVLEVASRRPHRDEAKRRSYASENIPLHLLVNRDDSSVTLFSTPKNEKYRQLHTVPFGTPLPLPDPFKFDLDTSDFL